MSSTQDAAKEIVVLATVERQKMEGHRLQMVEQQLMHIVQGTEHRVVLERPRSFEVVADPE
eukprot:8992791-Prorocentrum_lima.AAC.1